MCFGSKVSQNDGGRRSATTPARGDNSEIARGLSRSFNRFALR
ncbi:hypothetical protein CKA32_000958 [Geitlerinema sp. FC II]|nr:hypothetical protein CKA32_000958 [Geitlerinema sp. FC II]